MNQVMGLGVIGSVGSPYERDIGMSEQKHNTTATTGLVSGGPEPIGGARRTSC